MRILLGGLLAAALVAMPTSAADDTKVKSRAEQFTALKEEFQKAENEFRKAYFAAKTAEEKKEALTKRPSPQEYAGKLQKLIDLDPKDDLALEMLTFNLTSFRNASPKVMDALTTHHVKNPKIAVIAEMFAMGGPDGSGKLLEKILADNPDKRAQGLACLGLAVGASQSENSAEAEKLFARVEKEFGDVKTSRGGTLADMAKPYLFEMKNLGIGKTAPDVESQNLEGKKVKLSDYKGKVVVLDIWATWCGPCRAMIPHEREMVKKLESKPFALISVSADDEKKTLTDFIAKEPMPWHHWWEGRDGQIMKNWNIRFFPTMYVIDAKGVIRFKNIRGKELEEAVEKLVAEATGSK